MFASMAVVAIIVLAGAGLADAKTDDQIRVDEKVRDLEQNKEAFQKLSEMELVLTDEMAELLYENEHGSPENMDENNVRIAEIEDELDMLYSRMEKIQEIIYDLIVVPDEKAVRLLDILDDVAKTPSINDSLLDAYLDHKTEKLVFVYDPKSIANMTGSEKAEFKRDLDQKIDEKTGDEEYRIESVEELGRPTTCRARDNSCNPTMGGLKVQVTTGSSGTHGFAASRNGEDGFVITAHQAGFVTGGDVRQYIPTVGVVDYIHPNTIQQNDMPYVVNNCDCAFVENIDSVTTQEKVWTSGYGRFTITDEATDTDHEEGTMVRKSGITTGVTAGMIISSDWYNVYTDMHAEPGDSGSPVYAGTGGSGKLYGMLWGGNIYGAIYVKYNSVEWHLGLD